MKLHHVTMAAGLLALGAMGVLVLASRRASEIEVPRIPAKAEAQESPFVTTLPLATSGSTPAAARTGSPAAPPALPEVVEAIAEDAAEQRFWEEVGVLLASRLEAGAEQCQASLLEKTAIHLGLEASGGAIFAGASRQALTEIAQAWQAREDGWAAVSSNASLDESVREQVEREIQELYETRKRDTMARLETVLGEGPRARGLKARLEEWIDAVR